ncbi:DUF4233 domain-containing protein [Nocardioides marmoriginsengisoli]|uniref:DUF4233 domain-containing protein n=1 Tax=Nocardioides marmoriginsengisoli TaxID=661483 RepID=A0A3N0CJ34_9ACTN|nr:DUF4233 domain-containing protein [Nocardioides marmoriginsengisoli]RNL63281.1 DUF4233 domain-containing protein [Nocardioides marmoriginsengisoli]
MKRRLCSAILFLQAIVLGLTTPVLVQGDDLSTTQALVIGLGLAVACVLVAGMLRKAWAYYVGWAIQVAGLALGAFTPVMIVLGVVFGVLWFTAVRLGDTIDRDKAAAGVEA